MYAFHLPDTIPAPGEPGGPPLKKDWRYFGGNIMPFDMRSTFSECFRDPTLLEPTFQHIMELGQQLREQQKRKH